MTIAELEERIDLLSLIERDHQTKKVGANIYHVNPCPVCSSKDHFTIYPETNSYSSFNDCCQGGSVYKYLMEVEGMNEEQAYQELLSLAGVEEHDSSTIKEKSPITPKPTKAEVIEPIVNYTNTILELYNKQTGQDKEYFINRGLTLETIDKYKLCIGDIKGYGGARAIIPTFKDDEVVFYTGRALTPKQEDYRKYENVPGKAYLFNSNILKKLDPGSKVLITESQIDTMLLDQLGFNSVSLSSSNNTNLFIETIKEIPGAEKLDYYTIFDNDKAGDLARGKFKYKHLKVDSKFNDVGEWYIAEKRTIKENIENQVNTLKRPDSLYNYLNNDYTNDVNSYKQFKDRKTGFKNLDDLTSLYPGLYVIGGLSTLGKTTFIHQLTDQMAEQGEHILFFSLEMATLELITKSLARLTVHTDKGIDLNSGVSSLNIRLNDIPSNKIDAVGKAIRDYEPISKRFNIIEGNFNTNIHTIRDYTKGYIRDNKVKPIVVIDYLQIIPGDENSFNNKDKIDQVVTGLKQLSRDENITVIVVSSLNRSNYLTPIDFESFKESGGIEYTADVVWGLQLQAIHEEIFNKNQNIKEKREVINQAKKSNPRRIELVCLKNRNGISNYSCNFTYYPKYDLFISEDDTGDKGFITDYSNVKTRRL